MREYLLIRIRHWCGGCGRRIRAGEIAARLTLPNSRVVLWRCVECDPVPADVVATNEADAIAEAAPLAERIAKLKDTIRRTLGPAEVDR